jgi:hypothetical protein
MPQNNMLTPLQNMQLPIAQGVNNIGKQPKFPRLRSAWEGVKKGAGNFLFGNPGGVEQYSTATPEQQNVLQLLQQLGVQGLQNPYAGFAPLAQQAQNNFYQQTVPSLAERFSSMGSNSLSSPAFASQLGQAGSGLQQELAAMQAGYGQQNLQQILQLLQLGLQPQSENVFRPRESGLVQGLIGAAPNFYQSYQLNNALKGLLK